MQTTPVPSGRVRDVRDGIGVLQHNICDTTLFFFSPFE